MIFRRADWIESPEWKGLLQCWHCGAVAPEESWDNMGLHEGEMQCLGCMSILTPIHVVPAEEWFQPLPTAKQGELFA